MDCNGNIYNIGMGCCEPKLGPIENYYTKPTIDRMLDEITSAITSGCCITPEQVDEKIEEAISGVTVSGVTEEELNEAIASAKTEIEAEIPSLDGYATEQWVENKHYITGVDLSDYALKSEIPVVPTSNTAFTNDAGYLTEHQSLSGYATEAFVSAFTYDKATIDEKVAGGGTFDPTQYYNKTATDELLAEKLDATAYTPADLTDYVTYEDMSDYVGDVYTKDEVNDLFVTKQYFQKNAVTYTEYNTTIYNLRQEIESLKSAISACCSTTGETYTRWITVPNEYTCSGTSKYAVEKEQTSTDNINWTDTGNTRRGGLIELYSASCGYVPPVTYKVTMRYTDGTEDNRECDGSDVLRALNASNSGNISGVTVGSCIYEIGNLCFHEYTGLTSVSLPSSITKIDKLAFSSCRSLSSITIPTGVTYIGEQAFRYCTSLTEITIPSGVTDISYATFIQCNGLTGITFPNTLETIGADALFKCTSLSSITIPSSVTHIGERAFGDNTSLENVTVLATTPPVLDYQDIFFGDHNLTAIYVPASSLNAYKTAWSEYENLFQAITT